MKRLCPRRLGSLVQANARRLVFLLSLALLILCAAINSAKLDVELSSWIQRTSRVESELQTIESAIGDGAGANSLLILQTPKRKQQQQSRMNRNYQGQEEDEGANNNDDILSVKSMLFHLEALAIATHVTIDLFDVSWSLKDICLAPTPPDYEGLLVNQMLDHLMPCVIKTPLDCFWDGAKLLGPEQDVRMSSLGPRLKWTTLNPILMIEMQQQAHPHASFPYQTLLDWMRRVGINNGYLDRPCLDPSDIGCPATAPNKLTGEGPNIGHALTGGCHGLATKQMHWSEDELVGGVVRNNSGHIVGAEALQSTVLLMGERDVYDYWRKTSKVQDINNWSTDKAKLVLDNWQKRFREELAQFARTSMKQNAFKIHTLTPKSMLEPIDDATVLDLTNFKFISALMTIITCIVFPSFKRPSDIEGKRVDETKGDDQHNTTSIGRCRIIVLALCVSTVVILTFISSLGLSSFMNLPFNMATTQILPPLALFYGYRQALMIARTFSKHYQHSSIDEVVTECLMELMPIIVMECATFTIPLIVATAFPVQATRVFTLQAITYILLSTLIDVLLIPSLLTIFLIRDDCQSSFSESSDSNYSDTQRSRSMSPGVISIVSRKSCKSSMENPGPTVDEQIFSRLQDDLRNIKNDPLKATDFNFSAQFGPDGIKTSFSLRRAPDTNEHHHVHHNSYQTRPSAPEPSAQLPDLLLRPDMLDIKPNIEEKSANETNGSSDKSENPMDVNDSQDDKLSLTGKIATSKIAILFMISIKIIVCVFILTQGPSVKVGLHLREILLKGSDNYESFMIREKYFPVYNIFMVTKGGLDYPSKQALLHEFYDRVSNIDGIMRHDKQGVEKKFWLTLFRDWLFELQNNFDIERNRSLISKDGWTDDSSDSAKLAYKLLVQTGKIDNPIDKNLVDTNRLVDKNGIINQRAFYYYLTAWVMNDAFTYSSSEADFKPEPKTWNENPNDLRIERSRPLNYAQIPFLMKFPEDKDSMKSILEIRKISQAFELIDLPNFPTGIPFIFWDQFINLDYLFYVAILMIAAVLFLLIGLAYTNFVVAAILVLPTMATLPEIYCILGFLSIPFNSIIGVMIISIIGIATGQSIQVITRFELGKGNLKQRVSESIRQSFRTVIISLVLLSSVTLVFYCSKIDFMTKYSHILIYTILSILFNSLLLTPSLLAIFGRSNDQTITNKRTIGRSPSRSPIRSPILIMKTIRERKMRKQQQQNNNKKRGLTRVQSDISLSTISEEPQIEALAHDLKLNFSIRC